MTEVELLERRVAALEQEVEGEKVVTRYILEQVRLNGDDLAALRTRASRIEARLDDVERRLDAIERRLDDLPRQIAEVMRQVLAERDARAGAR